MEQGRNLGEQFYTNTACFLDLFAESPVGVLVHWNASKTLIVRPAWVDTSLLWLFAYFALDIFTLHVLQGPQVKVALSLILEHLAVTILLLPIQEKGIGIVNYLVSKLRLNCGASTLFMTRKWARMAAMRGIRTSARGDKWQWCPCLPTDLYKYVLHNNQEKTTHSLKEGVTEIPEL